MISRITEHFERSHKYFIKTTQALVYEQELENFHTGKLLHYIIFFFEVIN